MYLYHFRTSLWRRKWQPTPVYLPGESLGQRSLVVPIDVWGHTELDTTESTQQQQENFIVLAAKHMPLFYNLSIESLEASHSLIAYYSLF